MEKFKCPKCGEERVKASFIKGIGGVGKCALCRETGSRPPRRQTIFQRASRSANIRAGKWGALGRVSPGDLERLWGDQDGLCGYCRKAMGEGAEPDHRLSMSKGGSNTIPNLVWTCGWCNQQKSTLGADWLVHKKQCVRCARYRRKGSFTKDWPDTCQTCRREHGLLSKDDARARLRNRGY